MKMKAVLILSLYVVILRAKAWQTVKNPFEFIKPSPLVHKVEDCMMVASQEGDYVYVKHPLQYNGISKRSSFNLHRRSASALDGREIRDNIANDEMLFEDEQAAQPPHDPVVPDMAVCGIYFVTDATKIVEVTVKRLDINCETGGLMGFVDGWELNGQYFPSVKDHELPLEKRVQEFCNENHRWPATQKSYKKTFKSSQNAAVLQYRAPIRGAFVISARFLHNPEPCHIMTEGVSPYYTLKNYGLRSNCTLTALYPAVISIIGVQVGEHTKPIDYNCENKIDKVDIGGSSGLDSYDMEKTSTICGKTGDIGPEQAIFCGVTTVRLTSSGNYNNQALIAVRTADEKDLNIATLICEM